MRISPKLQFGIINQIDINPTETVIVRAGKCSALERDAKHNQLVTTKQVPQSKDDVQIEYIPFLLIKELGERLNQIFPGDDVRLVWALQRSTRENANHQVELLIQPKGLQSAWLIPQNDGYTEYSLIGETMNSKLPGERPYGDCDSIYAAVAAANKVAKALKLQG